ncbi:sugar phosphate isomerase/epimerase family protein [Pseudonocardia sichuanensis]|uniref:2-keto-myo-inositol dehydratase n=1 Tax=Pseudonocardia kunmingensis TaxID=630975 RepID=A0A543DQS1_9PSEU|nr:sugar phosphate isomerase/epimerase [Pseudonocardia kunmingensis]TQM11664.1 2-keto-myo-inositol dehydratase [Pseudonocardia kunmingensis]
MQVRLGCGQITWRGLPDDAALDDIRRAGYEGAPWSPRHGENAEEIKAYFDGRGLDVAPGYLWGDFWDAARRAENIAAARRYAELSKELGLTEVYVSAGGFDRPTASGRTRRQAVGHVTAEDALPEPEFRQLADTLQAVGEVMLGLGVRACYHNHAGTFVETEDEIERLLAAVDPDVVFLGPDTGHLAWAGVDVVEFARRHATRIKTMHLKDVVPAVRDEGAAAGWDYKTFEEHGIWTEINEGGVDFTGLFSVLDGVDFDGWLIVETDVTQKASPLESATASRKNLRELGI